MTDLKIIISRRIYRCTFLLLFLGLCNAVSAAGLPDLSLYEYAGLSDKIVVANVSNATVDSIVTASGPVHITMLIANLGTADTGGNFMLTLYVDNSSLGSVEIAGITTGTGLKLSYPLSPFCTGIHSIRVELDSTGIISESDETNNSYTRIITVDQQGDATGTADICPTSFDFAGTKTDDHAIQSFLLSNTGCGLLAINNASIIGADADSFTISKDDCAGKTLSSRNALNTYDGTCRIAVTFSPESLGLKNATLQILTSDPENAQISIPLTGSGLRTSGDIDGSGKVTLSDGILALQVVSAAVLNLENSPLQPGGGIDDDGKIGLKDAAFILQKIKNRQLPLQYETVRISTASGNILIWMYDQTPLHKENFLSLVRQGFYDGLLFHRVINGFMIQGGDPNGDGTGGPGYTIPAEIDCSLPHVYGAVAAARLGDSVNPLKDSSGSQFYIVENQDGTSFLDMNYTVFGQVIDGMNVVEAIADVPVDGSDKPLQNVVMTKVEVVSHTAQQLLDQYGFTVPGP